MPDPTLPCEHQLGAPVISGGKPWKVKGVKFKVGKHIYMLEAEDGTVIWADPPDVTAA